MSVILGISAFYHDSAAALVIDGRIVAAAQEERFTRKKHDAAFPQRAAEFCLRYAGLTVPDIDWVIFYEKPLLKFDRLLETYLGYAPRGFLSFRKAIPEWLRTKLFLPREMRKALGEGYTRRFAFASHHESHAASAFYPSPHDEAAILTLDGVGEWATATMGVGQGERVHLTHQISFPHSLGLLYSAFTYYCGFRVNSGEYKLMGLAPYGEPVYADLIRERLIDLKEDGSFRMDMTYFNYAQGLTMTSPRFHRLFGGPPREPEAELTRREMDLAASIQAVTEEVVLKMGRHVHAITGMDRLCLAGGVALNCVANGRLLREGPFRDIWIQPAAGDAGGALGAALLMTHQVLGRPRVVVQPDAQCGSALGPEFTPEKIEHDLTRAGADFTRMADEDDLCQAVASEIERGHVVGWFQGRMEFGPRALGGRSILGDPRRADMQSVMNLKIKFRESFRPFAPSVLKERAEDFFDLEGGQESPYMLLTTTVRAEQLLARGPRQEPSNEFARLREVRSTIPAVTHVNNSARVQTVDAARNPLYFKLLSAFDRLTGCPVLINTSFNVRGEPIVATPLDAYRCFLATGIDCLAIGPFLLRKAENRGFDAPDIAIHLAQFQLD